MTEVQRLREKVKFLEAALTSPQPGNEQNLKFQLDACREELANLKGAFTRLRKDRDWQFKTRQENYLSMLKLCQENLELKQRLIEFGVDQ